MFGFFKKKRSESEAIEYSLAIAAAAEIDPVLESGLYSGFLIRINGTGSTLAPHFAFDSARNAFASAIEKRIDASDFEQIMEDRQAMGLPPLADDGRGTAVRAVLGPNDTPLMRWNY